MEKILDEIKRNGSDYLINWLSSVDNENLNLTNLNLLTLAEKISGWAFNEKESNLDFAKCAILIYEKINTDGALLSAAYLRIRAFSLIDDIGEHPFFTPLFILNNIREKLSLKPHQINTLTTNWQSLHIDKIKLLRVHKNWIKILLKLEEATGVKYSEFQEWRPLYYLLP